MNEAVDILLAMVKRIKDADCSGDTTVAKLETEAFQATLGSYVKNGRIAQAEYGVFYEYLVGFSAQFCD